MSTVNLNPRTLAVWALLAFVALYLFFEFAGLVIPGRGNISDRAAEAGFRSLVVMAMPVLAVLLARHLSPALATSRLVATIALGEYAVAVGLGFLTYLVGLGSVVSGVNSPHAGLGAMRYFVMGAAELALLCVASLVVIRAFLAERRRAEPAPSPVG